MQLLVRSLGGRTRAVSLDPTDTVEDLKAALEQVRNIRAHRGHAQSSAAAAAGRCSQPPAASRDTRGEAPALQAAGGIPARHQVLVHGGRLLEDGASLGACGLGHGSTVHQTARLRGGKPVKVRGPQSTSACTL